MFLNNPASTRSILASNENATTFIRSKSNGENGTKKTAFNEKVAKTPHCNKDGAPSKSGQTTQRRRRAFGDISNRKTVGAKGGGKGGAGSRHTLSNNLTKRSSVSTNNSTAQVKFFKTPSTKSASVNKPRLELGVESVLKSASCKHEPHTMSANCDQVGVTTRWSDDNIVEESRLLFDLVPEDELNLVPNLRDEIMDQQAKESCQVERLEIERGEEQLLEQVREFHEANIQEIGTMFSTCNIYVEEDGELDFLNQKMPWEEENQTSVSSEGQYSLEVDPYNLWDDM